MIHIERTEGTDNWWVMKETSEGEKYLHQDGSWHDTAGNEGTFQTFDEAMNLFHQSTQQEVTGLVEQWKKDLRSCDEGAAAKLTWKKIKEITLTIDQIALLEQQFNLA